MAVDSYTTPDGRTVVRLQDSEGKPYKFVSNSVSIRGYSEFNEAIAIPLSADPSVTPPRPDLTRGQIIVNAQATFDTVVFQYVLAEIVVFGFCGSTSTVLARAQLGGDAAIMRVVFEEDDTFDKILIAARQIVDGLPSTNTASVFTLNVAAVAYMWS